MSVPWSSKGTKATPVDADQLLIIDSEDITPSTTNKLITIGTLPSGDVLGPTGATDEAIARFDGTTGKLIQGGIITIDDNANANLIRSLQFVSHTAAPPSTVEYIAVVNNDFEINVTNGNNFKLEVDETVEYQYDATQADFNNNNLLMGTAYTQYTSIASPGVTGFATIGRLFLDSGNSNVLSIIRNGSVINLESSGEAFTWTADHSMATFKLTADASNDVILNAPTGQGVSIEVAGIAEYLFDTTQADFNNNNLIGVDGFSLVGNITMVLTQEILWPDNTRRITMTSGGLIIEVPSGSSHSLEVNSVVEYEFSSTIADFNGNNIQDVSNILDSNGNELLTFTTTASAVNELTIKNAATTAAIELQATGGDANIDVKFVPKGTGTFFGVRETWAWPLTDETTLPVVGVTYTTEPAPYDMTIEDAIAGLTTAGTGATLFTIDVLKENSVNADAFTTIFTIKPTIDASEFTSTTAATAMTLNVTTWEKGRRLQLKIDTLDTNTLGRGAKIELICHATAR